MAKHFNKCSEIGRWPTDCSFELCRHSTSGNLFLLSNGAVSWLSKKQPIVTLSTAEAEYVALSTAVQETVWLRKLLKDFGAEENQPTVIMEDNQGAICIAKNPVAHSRTKHIDILYHCIREAIRNDFVGFTKRKV